MNDDARRLISSLEAQEQWLVFTRFDNTDAWAHTPEPMKGKRRAGSEGISGGSGALAIAWLRSWPARGV